MWVLEYDLRRTGVNYPMVSSSLAMMEETQELFRQMDGPSIGRTVVEREKDHGKKRAIERALFSPILGVHIQKLMTFEPRWC